jgi:exodeoxyribonuclease VII small subunit
MTQNKYEDLVKELKEIVQKIEEGNISLDESIELYNKGATLIKQCETLLEEAELKIREISQE